jgi:hypothetical protein
MRLAAVTIAEANVFPTMEAQVAFMASGVGNAFGSDVVVGGVVAVGGVVVVGVLAVPAIGNPLLPPPPQAANVSAHSVASAQCVTDAWGRLDKRLRPVFNEARAAES